MSYDDILEALKKMPDVNDNNFTICLLDYVANKDLVDFSDNLYLIVKSGEKIEVRFSAFYALLIIYRESQSLSKLIELVDEYGEEFVTFKLYNIVQSIYYRNKVILGNVEAGKQAIYYAEKACKEYRNNPAVIHHYCETVAFLCEFGMNVSDKMLDAAIRRVNSAIQLYPNRALFYCTKGRLFALQGRFLDAETNILKAIDFERVNNSDGIMNVGKYNYHLSSVQLRHSKAELQRQTAEITEQINSERNRIDKLISKLDDSQTRYLEYLGFFAAVISYIMISIDVVVKVDDFSKAASLILLLGGSLSMVFSGFRSILSAENGDKKTGSKYGLIIGIILIVIGLLVVKYLKI